MLRLATLIVLPSLLLAGCGATDEDPSAQGRQSGAASPTATPSDPQDEASRSARPEVIGTVARDLEVPWGIAFLPDGSALVTERDSGKVLQVKDRRVTEVGRVPQAEPLGEAGLLGVAVSPDFARDGRVFFYATTGEDNRVLRTTFRDGELGTMRPILTGIPNADHHDGGRMVFGPDTMLYVSTGEAGRPELAQDPTSLGGKILRITQDGDPAPGNPRADSPVWTLGHRNVQGLAFDDQGRLWASEFGQNAYDELNLIQKGKNYGWPKVEGVGSDSRYQNPQVTWPTDDASPSGLAFLDGRLWLGALQGERLYRVDVTPQGAAREQGFFVGKYGRVRSVVPSPDGNLWVTTSNRDGRGDPASEDDRILLVRP